MNKFFKNGVIFLIFLVVLFWCFNLILLQNQKKLFKLPENTTKVFFGNSMIETGVNDSLIDNSYNFARSAEAPKNVYAKIKLIHKSNPQVDTIVLGFDDLFIHNVNLNPTHNSLLFTNQFSIEDIYQDMIHEPGFNGFYHLYDINKIRPMIESYYKDPTIKDLFLGGYIYLKRDVLGRDSIEGINAKTIFLSEAKMPEITRHYIDKIVDYCKNNNLTLIFLETPTYHHFWKNDRYEKIHKENYPEIIMLNYMHTIYPDSCYGDVNHLNYKGAKLFSTDLNQHLKKLHDDI